MEATWAEDYDHPFESGEVRTMNVALGNGYIQQVDVEFVRCTEAPYELYYTDPYFAGMSDEMKETVDTLVGRSTMGLTEYVSMQEPHSIPTV